MMKITHGGNIVLAAKKYKRPIGEWLDLSTGISPWSYPVPELPTDIWQRLPYESESLLKVAEYYYKTPIDNLTAIPGSQYAISHLPRFIEPSSVAIPSIGYQEHKKAWESAGHNAFLYQSWQELLALVDDKTVSHVVIINPNNPTGEYCSSTILQKLLKTLSGYCLVDEAFIDLTPEYSLSNQSHSDERIIVLRSVGKFFGLAGLRLGFMLGKGKVVEDIRNHLEPWGVSHPALYIGEQALENINWQQQQRKKIQQQSQSVFQLLSSLFESSERVESIVNSGLFVTITGDKDLLESLYEQAAEQGMLLRYDTLSSHSAWLRIGLPGQYEQRLKDFFQEYLL